MIGFVNIRFHLRFIDSRDIVDVVASLSSRFGGEFVSDDESRADGSLRFECDVLGVAIGLAPMEAWEDGIVYRLSGVSSATWRAGATEVDLGAYVHRLLEDAGCGRVMTVEEFRDESQRRGLR